MLPHFKLKFFGSHLLHMRLIQNLLHRQQLDVMPLGTESELES